MNSRRGQLAIVNERPVTDAEQRVLAEQALEAAENQAHASPDDVLNVLRERNTELARIADAAMEQANTERTHAQQLTMQLDRAKSDQDTIRQEAAAAVSKVRADAAQVIAATQQQAQIAERTVMAAGLVQRAAGTLGAMASFVIDRSPVLGTLTGAYLLARNLLPEPSLTQLGLFGLYGLIAVVPAIYLSVRKA